MTWIASLFYIDNNYLAKSPNYMQQMWFNKIIGIYGQHRIIFSCGVENGQAIHFIDNQMKAIPVRHIVSYCTVTQFLHLFDTFDKIS